MSENNLKKVENLSPIIYEDGTTLLLPDQFHEVRETYIMAFLPIFRTTHRSVKSICDALRLENPEFPSHWVIYTWVDRDVNGLRARYQEARRTRARMAIDEIIEIADDNSGDLLYVDAETGQRKMDREFVERSKLKIQVRQFQAINALPEDYGVKKEQPIHAVQIVLPEDYSKFISPIKSDESAENKQIEQ